MATAIELSDEIVNDALYYGEVNSRSAPGQIEHWVSIGRIAEENPDLPYGFIKDILLSKSEMKDNTTTPYQFG